MLTLVLSMLTMDVSWKEACTAPLGHDVSNSVTVSPTCKEEGYDTGTCARCGDELVFNVTAIVAHDAVAADEVEPTCTEPGHEEGTRCSMCGKWFIGAETAALGHEFANYAANNDASCTVDGTKTGKCVRCDATDTVADEGSALGHDYCEWQSTKSASCVAEGSLQRVCKTCKRVELQSEPALGHSWQSDYTVDETPTYVSDRSESIHCSKCVAVKDSRTIAKLVKHQLTSADVKLSATAYPYDGKVKKPSVTVSIDGKSLATSAYKVAYSSGCKSVGSYTVTVSAVDGNVPIKGSASASFAINPKKPSAKSCYKGTTYVTARWYKMSTKMSTSRISGYQVELSTAADFSENVKKYNVKGYKATSKKVSKLKRHTKYYVHVRTVD